MGGGVSRRGETVEAVNAGVATVDDVVELGGDRWPCTAWMVDWVACGGGWTGSAEGEG